ncbi:MAG: helix-turn-helix domain-containing protein [Chitinophagaceae bacterium]|nr:helix-turn-helix domain-containing protein [Chitinophagaceae bacterium]
MSMQILTKEDLHQFKTELFQELQTILPKDENLKLKRWLKTDEVKKLLKVSPGTLQTLRINGTLSYTKLGGIIYYDYDHIEKILQHNLHLATKPIDS